MRQILETQRLRLRELNHADAAFVVELLNSPGWLEFIGDRKVTTEDQARMYLDNGPLRSYSENGFGLYMVETRETHTSIGVCGIIRREKFDHPDLGFAFLPEFNGLGYGREIATATLEFARHHLKLPIILAVTRPQNERSIRLLKDIGLRYSRTLQSPDNEDLFLFSIELNARHPGSAEPVNV